MTVLIQAAPEFTYWRAGSAPEVAQNGADVVLFEGDCIEMFQGVETGSVKLAITSPPYNIGKAYEKQSPLSVYLETMAPVLEETVRVLHPEGSVCWQTGNYVDKGEVFPLDIYFYPMFKNLGLKLRNRIIWRFGHGLHASKRFSGRYETILWFTRDNYTFNLDPVRVPSKYPGKRNFKGPNKGKPSGNPMGKNPSDVWDIVLQDWEEEVWDIPNVKSNHPEKTGHPCQFPVELVERCVLALTDEGDTVLDMFGGVGSAMIAAAMHGRRAIGADTHAEYIDLAEERLAKLQTGELRTRPLGKPVHVPSGREKVSQVPMEWQA